MTESTSNRFTKYFPLKAKAVQGSFDAVRGNFKDDAEFCCIAEEISARAAGNIVRASTVRTIRQGAEGVYDGFDVFRRQLEQHATSVCSSTRRSSVNVAESITKNICFRQHHELDRDQKKHLKLKALSGNELVDSVARLCVMNLYLHGVGGDQCPIEGGVDSLAEKPGVAYEMVLTNPTFGKKSSITVINEEGDESKEALRYVRDDFWATTSNKQLNFCSM